MHVFNNPTLYGISSFKILSDTQVWPVWVIVHCPYASLYGVGICLDFQFHPFICGLSITSKLAAGIQRWMGYTICLDKQSQPAQLHWAIYNYMQTNSRHYSHWWMKVTKSGGANWLTKQYFYYKKIKILWSTQKTGGVQPHSSTLSAAYDCSGQ